VFCIRRRKNWSYLALHNTFFDCLGQKKGTNSIKKVSSNGRLPLNSIAVPVRLSTRSMRISVMALLSCKRHRLELNGAHGSITNAGEFKRPMVGTLAMVPEPECTLLVDRILPQLRRLAGIHKGRCARCGIRGYY